MKEFSEELRQKAQESFTKASQYFGKREAEITAGLANCNEQERICMQFLYGAMPLSDLANYSFALFLSYVDHALFVRETMPWGKSIPEDIFLNHVMFYRINNEDIEDCRKQFYDLVFPRLKESEKLNTMAEAALELNYWCQEHATYQLTDDRTASPLTVLRCAYGRCGEESTFAVTALRSVCIPTRQIYTPRWAHCDDNHAWVEVWCDGDWHYLGACEPEAVLDKGWFTAAASRAMMIHSRTFSDFVKGEEIVTQEGLTTVCNALKRYADTTLFQILVEENGQPLPGVSLRLELINYSEYSAISTLVSDKDGQASITIGLGDIHIHASKAGKFLTTQLDLREKNKLILDFTKAVFAEEDSLSGEEKNSIPPKDNMRFAVRLTDEQTKTAKRRYDASAALRKQRESAYQNQNFEMSDLPESLKEEAARSLSQAKGNLPELIRFLDDAKTAAEKALRVKLLSTLSVKDKTDLRAAVLESHLEACPRGTFSEEIFIKYVLNPRISLERLSAWRQGILAYFTSSQEAEFTNHPQSIWQWVSEHIITKEEREYGSLLANPAEVLQLPYGTIATKKVLFVAICRTLGIPARINPENQAAQYWADDVFCNVEKENTAPSLPLTLLSGDETKWEYFQNWSIAQLRDGVYHTLDFSDKNWLDQQMTVNIPAGQYRLLTTKRMPNGSVFAKEYRFAVKDHATNELRIRLRDAKVSDMLENMEILDFKLREETGKTVLASEFTEGKKNILFWLEESKEPTEHILNELIDLYKNFSELDAQLIFILNNTKSSEDSTLSKAIGKLPRVRILYDDFGENVSTIARRMYVDPEKLPLVVVTNPGLNGVYAFSGYNVGLGDLLLKILSE